MSYKKYTRRKREQTLQKIAMSVKKKHDKEVGNKKTILVPHPTIPHTLIEKVVK